MDKLVCKVPSEEMLLSQHQSGGCGLCRWLARWSSMCKGPGAGGAFRIPRGERRLTWLGKCSPMCAPSVCYYRTTNHSSGFLFQAALREATGIYFSFRSLFWVHLILTTFAQVSRAAIHILGKHSQKECLESVSNSKYYHTFFPTIFKIDKNPHLFSDMVRAWNTEISPGSWHAEVEIEGSISLDETEHSSDILNVSSAFDRCVPCHEHPFRHLWAVYHVLALSWGLGSVLQCVSILVNVNSLCDSLHMNKCYGFGWSIVIQGLPMWERMPLPVCGRKCKRTQVPSWTIISH